MTSIIEDVLLLLVGLNIAGVLAALWFGSSDATVLFLIGTVGAAATLTAFYRARRIL